MLPEFPGGPLGRVVNFFCRSPNPPLRSRWQGWNQVLGSGPLGSLSEGLTAHDATQLGPVIGRARQVVQ